MSGISFRRVAENIIFEKLLRPFYFFTKPWVYRRFYKDLKRHTDYYNHLKWLGNHIKQAPLDLWTIQETLYEVKPELLIECGTYHGGSAVFYGQLFDLMDHGRIITIDIEKQHDLDHPRVDWWIGSTVAPEILERVKAEVDKTKGPIMVILDSDHSTEHVTKELNAYHEFVTPGSFMMVQDGVISSRGVPGGPLKSIIDFLPDHPEFEVDEERVNRFIVTHHPMGWLKKKGDQGSGNRE